MKDNSDFPRSEVPSTSRRSVLAGLAALGVVYAMPGLFQVNEAMAEPARKPSHDPGHSKKSRRSRRSKPSHRSRHSKSGKNHGRRSHLSKHHPRRSHPSKPGSSRRSRASRVMRQPTPSRPI